MKEKEKKFETNIFYYYANEYMQRLTADEDIQGINMTELFWEEIEHELRNDELVNININAKVRMSKSTTGIYISKRIYDLMVKVKNLKDKEPFGIKNIVRDQQEYSKLMRDPNTGYTIICTDEINELEETGENVTVERALNNVFSNVQAGRYVHRVSCSPKDVADPNADIFLEIISVDRKEKITHAHLYYRMFKAGNQYMQLLGYVDFHVNELLGVWDKKVKRHFLKPKRTKEDIKEINRWRGKDFYTEYMVRKYEKMDLITQEGIMRPRLLDYAGIILHVEERLRSLARLGNVLNKNTIRNYIKMFCRKEKIPTSIVGEELMTQEADGILNLWKSYHRLNSELKGLERKREMNKINEEDYQERLTLTSKIRDDLMEAIQSQMDELRRYEEINKKYNEVKSQ